MSFYILKRYPYFSVLRDILGYLGISLDIRGYPWISFWGELPDARLLKNRTKFSNFHGNLPNVLTFLQHDTETSNLCLGVSGANDPADRKLISNDLNKIVILTGSPHGPGSVVSRPRQG